MYVHNHCLYLKKKGKTAKYWVPCTLPRCTKPAVPFLMPIVELSPVYANLFDATRWTKCSGRSAHWCTWFSAHGSAHWNYCTMYHPSALPPLTLTLTNLWQEFRQVARQVISKNTQINCTSTCWVFHTMLLPLTHWLTHPWQDFRQGCQFVGSPKQCRWWAYRAPIYP